jgi:hypothetical protein
MNYRNFVKKLAPNSSLIQNTRILSFEDMVHSKLKSEFQFITEDHL